MAIMMIFLLSITVKSGIIIFNESKLLYTRGLGIFSVKAIRLLLLSFELLHNKVSMLGHPLCYMSLVMRKPAFCIRENKDADQLCGNRKADQRLCFRYIDSTIPLLSKSEISSLYTIYGHGDHLGHVTWTIYINICSPFPRRLRMKFGFD